MQDELLYTQFSRGSVVQMSVTENQKAVPYLDIPMRVIFADSTAVLAQPYNPSFGDPKPVLLIPFDGSTGFDFIPPGLYKFGQLLPGTPVLDLNDDPALVNQELWSTLGEVYPPHFEQPAIQDQAQPQLQPLVQLPPTMVSVDRSREFRPGTTFTVTSSQHAGLGRYIGIVFQSSQSDANGVLALPEQGSGLSEAVYLPYAGTDFDFNPPGRRSFATGIAARQQVYNPVTARFVFVEEFYDDWWGLPFLAAPVLYYDTYVPFGVVYDPFYDDPFFW